MSEEEENSIQAPKKPKTLHYGSLEEQVERISALKDEARVSDSIKTAIDAGNINFSEGMLNFSYCRMVLLYLLAN